MKLSELIQQAQAAKLEAGADDPEVTVLLAMNATPCTVKYGMLTERALTDGHNRTVPFAPQFILLP